MRVFRNKITKQIFRLNDDQVKIIKALEYNDGFQELFDVDIQDSKNISECNGDD